MRPTKNDLRVMRIAIKLVDDNGFDGFGPHGAADWTAIRRLEKAGFVKFEGHGVCEDCDNPKHRNEQTEGPLYVATLSGRAAYAISILREYDTKVPR